MSDRDDARLRELTYRLMRMAPPAPPFPEEPMTQLTPPPPPRRRLAPVAWVAVAALAVFLAIGLPVLLTRSGDQPVAVTSTSMQATTTGPTTTGAATTTTPTSTSPTSAAPLPVVDLDGQRWIRTDSGQGIVGSEGDELLAATTPMIGLKAAAWDGSDGIVYFSDAGELHWVRTGADVVVPYPTIEDGPPGIGDVVDIEGRPTVSLVTFAGELTWIDLQTGDVVAGDPSRVEHFEETGLRLGAQGRTVHIEFPENLDAERDETGALVWPFDLPELVVQSTDGEELARVQVGSEERPFALLNDFDGRRVVFSLEPNEPALGPRLFTIIDLECADCTEIFETGPDSVDLVGTLESEGPVVADLGS